VHLHVRDAEGRHSLDPGRYVETLAELSRAVPDLRVQITTEAAGLFDVATQLDCLTRVRPDWASISIREIARDPARASAIYGTCAEQGTQVQHILYDSADIALLRDWRARSVVAEEQTSVLFVLGRYTAGQVASPVDLMEYVDARPTCATGWSAHSARTNMNVCWRPRGGAVTCGSVLKTVLRIVLVANMPTTQPRSVRCAPRLKNRPASSSPLRPQGGQIACSGLNAKSAAFAHRGLAALTASP
jgi:hypothetical protein